MEVLFPKLSSEQLSNKTYIKDLSSSLKLMFLINFIYFESCLPDVILSKYCLNITFAA